MYYHVRSRTATVTKLRLSKTTVTKIRLRVRPN